MAASSLQMTRREDGSYMFDFVNHSQQVLFTLNECRQFANLCDCSVVVEGQVFYAHKGVLVSCSDYFKEIFTTQAVIARQSIDLINVKVPGFQLFIEFAYMARMAITMQDVDTVLNTAVTLKSATMLEACCEFLKSQLTGDNCVDIISIAEAYNLTEIKRQANRLMCERLIELSQTYKKGQLMPDTKEDFEALTARFAAQTAQQAQAQLPMVSASQMVPPLMQTQQSLVEAQAQAILEATTKLDVAVAAAAAVKLDPIVAINEQSAGTETDDEDDDYDDPGGMDSDQSFEEDPQVEEKDLFVQLPPASTLPKPVLRLQNKSGPMPGSNASDRTLKVETKAALKSPIVTRSRGRPRGRQKVSDLNLRPRRNLRMQRALRIKKGALAMPKVKKDYNCKICDIAFVKLRDLRQHTTGQHHKCNKCNKYFRHPHELEGHQIMHQKGLHQKGPKKYQCNFCGKQCGYSSALKIHIRTHTGEKPYKCDLCDQRFIQSINLKRHVLTNHSKETPYQCKFCNKKFSVYVYLKSHEITHSDHRPYQCEACGAMFKRKSDLRSHNRVHSTEKPFTCELCHAKFKSPNDLKTHTLIHNDRKPHTCDKCGASFKRTGHLNRHMMIHTNAKPFVCETCGAQFNRKENLRSHQRIHSGEQPYKCGVCGASFRHLSSLKMHEKNHWGDRTSQEASVPTHDPAQTFQHIAALMAGLGTPQQQASLAAAVTIAGTATTLPINTSTPTPVMATQQAQRDLIQVPLHPIQLKIYQNPDANMVAVSPHEVASPSGRTHMVSPPPAHMASALMSLQGLANQQQGIIPVSVAFSGAGTPPPQSVTPTQAMSAQQLQRDQIQIPLHPSLQVKIYQNAEANSVPTSTQQHLAISSPGPRDLIMASPAPAHMSTGLAQPIHVGSSLPQNLQVQSPAPQGIATTQVDHNVTFMTM